jgi:hypothetical protein
MCGVNHKGFTRPGYLIDVRAESIAAEGALFTRALAHHRQLNLTDAQLRGLLDLSREYHARQLGIRLRMAELGERVEQKRGRLTPGELAKRKPLLDERAELFHDDETLFFEFAVRGQDLLSDDQLDTMDRIYHQEKDEGLSTLAAALNRALSPTFAVSRATETIGVSAGSGA